MTEGQYIVSAKVCDRIKVPGTKKPKKVCDTISSVPMDKAQAHSIKKEAKKRVPKASVSVKKA